MRCNPRLPTQNRKSQNRKSQIENRKSKIPRAFTLIELLVVIGIIGLLAGILLVGLFGAGNSAKERQTRSLLENCRAMLTEFELNASIKAAPFIGGPIGFFEPNPYNQYMPGNVAHAPENVPAPELDRVSRTGPHVRTTSDVFSQIRRTPRGGELWAGLPPEKILNFQIPPPPATGTLYNVPLDGYGNPILYVPASGLIVYYTPANPSNAMPDPANPATQARVIRSPDGRPFFASAGPDGNFNLAPDGNDDNLYSFQN